MQMGRESIGQTTAPPVILGVLSLFCNLGTEANIYLWNFSLPEVDTQTRQVNPNLTPVYTSQVGDPGVCYWSQVCIGVGWGC